MGSTKTIKVDVRLVAATNRDLSRMVAEGRFRGHLCYRLNVFPLVLPPLGECPDDIPWLVRHLTQRIARGPKGAAARLGMKRSKLYWTMKKLGISRPE